MYYLSYVIISPQLFAQSLVAVCCGGWPEMLPLKARCLNANRRGCPDSVWFIGISMKDLFIVVNGYGKLLFIVVNNG